MKSFYIPMATKVLSEYGIVRLADLAVDKLELRRESEPESLQHPIKRIFELADTGKDVSSIEIVPVFEIRYRLQ